MIIGISGPYASGKSIAVRFLSERSFVALSLSDEVREELSQQGVAETRDVMIETANAIREREGSAALAIRASRRIQSGQNYVIDSIRHPNEVLTLRKLDERFVLVWIDAPEEQRLKRLRERGRKGDPTSLDQLRGFERRERTGEVEHGQRLDEVRELADAVIVNSGRKEELENQLLEIVQRSMHFERPDWDSYFMDIARVVARRSNCVKRHVAAVITLDRRIISTGYNGTPRGVRNCHEGGCPRCRSFAVGGSSLAECLCSHAEENAITQAAYHGVRVAGGTVYSTFCPCLMCTKMIINAGLREVVFSSAYPLGDVSMSLLKEAGITVRQLAST